MTIADLLNIFDILNRARNHQALTPSERGWVQGLQVAWHGAWPVVLSTLAAGVLNWLQAGTPFTWTTLGALIISAFVAGKVAFSQAHAKVVSASSPQEQQVGLFLEGLDYLTQARGPSEAGAPPQ